MKTITLLIALLFAGDLWAQSKKPEINAREANWTIVCADHAYVVDFLAEFEERPVITGRMGRAGKMAFLINTKTGTWTLLGYTDRGACIMAAGEDAEQLESFRRE